MQWLVGLLGALVGGSLTLLGGVLNHRRDRLKARVDRIRTLSASVLADATMLRDVVWEYQVQRQGALDSAIFDRARTYAYQSSFISGGTELRWLAQHTPLAPLCQRVTEALGDLAKAWMLPFDEYQERNIAFNDAMSAFSTEVSSFLQLRPRTTARYLQSPRR